MDHGKHQGRVSLAAFECIAVGISKNIDKIAPKEDAMQFVRDRVEEFWTKDELPTFFAPGPAEQYALMGIIAWIVLGLIAGAIAKFLMPGRDPGGIFITIIIGIVGAVIGGFIGNSLGVGDVTGVNLWSIVLSVVGAIVLLIVYRMVTGRRASA